MWGSANYGENKAIRAIVWFWHGNGQWVIYLLNLRIAFNFFAYLVICTEKYLRSDQLRTLSWSNYGAPLLFVESLTYMKLCFPLFPLACFFCWLIDADSVQICLGKIWTHLACSPVPSSVQICVLAVNLWTVFSCTFLVLFSITRQAFCLCTFAFWSQLGAKEQGMCFTLCRMVSTATKTDKFYSEHYLKLSLILGVKEVWIFLNF